MSSTVIPDITHPIGKYWYQPSWRQIVFSDTHATMSQETFDDLKDYSTSTPSGVYQGKMWKSHRQGKWWLRWYGVDDGDPRGLPTPCREIVIAPDEWMELALKVGSPCGVKEGE